MFDLHGRVAVVTGASGGLGRQFALALARQGADIAILARRLEKLEEVAGEIRALGVKCLPVTCDVTKSDSVRAAVEAVMTEYGHVDILVNNAGGGRPGAIVDYSDEDWRASLALDLGGVIILTRQAAAEWATTGVTVNALCPGFFPSQANSPEAMEAMGGFIKARTPMGRPGREGELDSSIVYLAADESTYVTGSIITCDGGWTCV